MRKKKIWLHFDSECNMSLRLCGEIFVLCFKIKTALALVCLHEVQKLNTVSH